jgi:diacylglycerol kinase (ATP)
MEVLNVVVANGRTAAGGRPVAPIANPCDGLLDVIVVKAGSMPALAKVGTRLVAGNYLGSPLVHHRRVRQVAVASDPGMWFNVDGELITNEPVSLRVLPGRQRVIVGPEFEAAPDESRWDV